MMSVRTFLLPALLGTSLLAMAPPLAAAPPGVDQLLRQAEYWNGKGRADLARQALNRVLQIDPGNAEARAALNGNAPTRPAPAAATPEAVERPVERHVERAPAPARAGAPAPADPGGKSRAAGFDALDDGNLTLAAARFQAALKARPGDGDALGGLGLVKLRGKHFAEARDFLERASAHGDSDKWAQALRAARFYAGLDDARSALSAGQLPKAEQMARDLAANDDQDGSANLLLGDILSREGRDTDAANIYSQAGAAGAANAGALRSRAAQAVAAQAVASGDVAGAVNAFQSAIAQTPDDPWLRYQFANFLLDQNHPADASTVMAPLVTTTNPDALYAAALFGKRVGSSLNAEALMAQIPQAQLTPEMKAFLVELKMGEAVDRIRALQKSGDIATALSGARALAASPHASVETLGAAADLMSAMGDNASADAAAEKAIGLPLAEPSAYQSIVSILAKGGHDLGAASLVARLNANGQGGATTGRLAAILAASQADRMRAAGQNAAAFDVLRAAWANAPSDRDILGALARLYLGGGMPGQAEQVYMMLAGQKADDLSAQIGLADAASAAKDFVRAQGAVQTALRLAPHDPQAYMAAAHFEQARGNKGAALRYLKQARAVDVAGPAAAGAGGFSGANPFANAAVSANPFAAAQPAPPANPFALPSRPAPVSPVAYGNAMPASDSAAGMSAFPAIAPAAANSAATLQRASFLSPNMSAGTASPVAQLSQAETPFGGHVPTASDPTLNRIDREIAALSGDTGAAVGATAGFRNRSGEAGLSKLNEIDASVYASAHIGRAKITATASPVVLDAGTASRSGLARFGTNATAEAEGIVNAQTSDLKTAGTQHDSGIAATLGIEAGALKADGGITPIGFQKTNIQGGVSLSPKIGEHVTVGVHAERRPVTDSLLSYAGTTDPVTGRKWGSVMKDGGGGSVSYDDNGNGLYADASYHRYEGENVRSNSGYEANLGGYVNVYKTDDTSVTAGANVNYQSYRNNQNEFTFGNGGYFSPQSFVSVAFPVHFKTTRGKWQLNADLSPGFQSYKQDETALYPTMADAQAQLAALKAQDTDVRSTYDSLSKTGFAFAGGLSGYYQLSDNTRLGGEASYNSFGVYKELRTMLSIRQSLGAGGQ